MRRKIRPQAHLGHYAEVVVARLAKKEDWSETDWRSAVEVYYLLFRSLARRPMHGFTQAAAQELLLRLMAGQLAPTLPTGADLAPLSACP